MTIEKPKLVPGAQRVLLWTMLVSLALAAGITIVVLLVSRLGDTAGRAIGTMCFVGLHCAAALALLYWAERRQSLTMLRIGLPVLGTTLALLVLVLWIPSGRSQGSFIASAMTLLIGLGCALVAVQLYESGRYRPLAIVSLAITTATAMGWILIAWLGPDHFEDRHVLRFLAVCTWLACALAYSCAQYDRLGRSAPPWLRQASLITVWGLAGLLTLAVLDTHLADEDMTWRLIGVTGILAGVLTLSQGVLGRLRQANRRAVAQQGPVPTIRLECPRCSAGIESPPGRMRCAACGLSMEVQVEGVQCEGCGYPLWNIPGRQCPECGHPF
jgi:hypothetical protein